MINKIYITIIAVLASLLMLGFIFYERAEKSHKEEKIELRELLNKQFYQSIDSLKSQISVSEEKLKISQEKRNQDQSQYYNLKQKLSKYEKIRYFDDIDSDAADSIISASRYRYIKQNNNSE